MKRYSNYGAEVNLSHGDVATAISATTALLDAADAATNGRDAMILERAAVDVQAFLLDGTPPIVPADRGANAS